LPIVEGGGVDKNNNKQTNNQIKDLAVAAAAVIPVVHPLRVNLHFS
jgi:hypothetical protein